MHTSPFVSSRDPILQAAARLFCASILLLSLCPAEAVLFYYTGDTNYNTTAPTTRALTNSGWQYEGAWGGFLGTVISSNCFITAQHVGGSVGQSFIFQGLAYPTVAAYEDTQSDLRILRVAGQFPTNAPLYMRRNERGKSLVVIGRGTERGVEVRVKNRLKGWQWGAWTSVQRWGQNKVSSLVDGGPGIGELLSAAFNWGGGRTEAHLSGGDSGGAVFIKDGRAFKLAGINYSVDGPYNTTNSGPGFDAAIFDQRGLYRKNADGSWTLPARTIVPGAFYATRISSHTNWINSVLSQP